MGLKTTSTTRTNASAIVPCCLAFYNLCGWSPFCFLEYCPNGLLKSSWWKPQACLLLMWTRLSFDMMHKAEGRNVKIVPIFPRSITPKCKCCSAGVNNTDEEKSLMCLWCILGKSLFDSTITSYLFHFSNSTERRHKFEKLRYYVSTRNANQEPALKRKQATGSQLIFDLTSPPEQHTWTN